MTVLQFIAEIGTLFGVMVASVKSGFYIGAGKPHEAGPSTLVAAFCLILNLAVRVWAAL